MPDESTVTVDPLAVNARDAARICGISIAMWWKFDRSGRCPRAIRMGRLKRWRVEELKAWLAMGCPPRNKTQGRDYRRDKAKELGNLPKKSGFWT